MRRFMKFFLVTALVLSTLGGNLAALPVANAAAADTSVRFEEIDMGWAEDAFTFPNRGGMEKVQQIESSSTDDLFVIAQLPMGNKRDIFHFGTDGTYHGLLVDRDQLAREVAGASWLAGGALDFYPEQIVFSEEADGNYLYIIHKQSDTVRPMLKYDLDAKTIVDAEVVIFSEEITSIQKVYDGLMYAAANQMDKYYTIDPTDANPSITTNTTTWGKSINSIVKEPAGSFVVKQNAYVMGNYNPAFSCDVGCIQLDGWNFSSLSVSADGSHVMGVAVHNNQANVYLNGTQQYGIDLHEYSAESAIIEVDNQGTLYVNTTYGGEILVYEYDSSSNTYKLTGSIGSERETSYIDADLKIALAENGHVFILDYYEGRLDEYDASGLYVRSMPRNLGHQLYNLAYYNGHLYAVDLNQNGAVVVISTNDLSIIDTMWEEVYDIIFTPDGQLLVALENEIQQYSVNPSNNELTLIHTYPFTGYSLSMHTDGEHVTIADVNSGWIHIINYTTYQSSQLKKDYSYSMTWMDSSGLIAQKDYNGGWQITHPDSGVLYKASEVSYGDSPLYIGDRQMMFPKTYYDEVKQEIRTELVGLRIVAPNLEDVPVFSNVQDERQVITGTSVVGNTLDLGIDFPMNGEIVRRLKIDRSSKTDIYFEEYPLIGINFAKSPGQIYHVVVGGQVGKRQAILQFNNINNDWKEGTVQFIFFEETGEIQAQFEKHQPSDGEEINLRETIDWSETRTWPIHLRSGETMRFIPKRAEFIILTGGEYVPVVLESTLGRPLAPDLQTPAFGTVFPEDTPEVTFTWDNPNADADYDRTIVLVATDPKFKNVVETKELTNETSYTMDTSHLYAGIPYYWKVVAAKTGDVVFDYSANGAFSIENWSVSLAIYDEEATSAYGTYEVLSSDLDQFIESGIAVSTSPNPSVTDAVYSTALQSPGQQRIELTGLQPDTTYYARSYAVTEWDTRYSGNISFTTLPFVHPVSLAGISFSPTVVENVYHATIPYEISSTQATYDQTLNITDARLYMNQTELMWEDNIPLQVGLNTFRAEMLLDGTPQIYTINVTREPARPNVVPPIGPSGGPTNTSVNAQQSVKQEYDIRVNGVGHKATLVSDEWIIASTATEESIVVEIEKRAWDQLFVPQGFVQVEHQEVVYRFPITEITTDSVLKQLQATEQSNLLFVLSMKWEKDKLGEIVPLDGMEVVNTPISLALQVKYENRSASIERFAKFAKLRLPVKDANFTTAVEWRPNGLAHIPTRKVQQGNQWFAEISNTTNGIFTLVQYKDSFHDVGGNWSQRIVEDMASRVIANGFEDGSYQPNTWVTRAQFAAFAVRTFGFGVMPYDRRFDDVASTDWYADAVETAVQYGIIQGYEDRTFRGEDLITREQAIAMLTRITKMMELRTEASIDHLQEYEDAYVVSEWAKADVNMALALGIIEGRGKAMLSPDAWMTRAEMAAIFYRWLTHIKR
ncbi:S-layer homology domain-containing protein [Paenibacillus sp. FA6]|uniref:S-layer homology domain-containing protein n=1 Tax=Paenibacillus sp. FA6 TaxID=3413029 RepID=UPI003F65F128